MQNKRRTTPKENEYRPMENDLQEQIGATALAFRGYNITNLGRSHDLLLHKAYGPLVRDHLHRAAEVCSEVVGRKVDLVGRVRHQRETSLRSYPDAIALIVAMEMAQIRLLEEFHGVPRGDASVAFGYSLGEITAVACGGHLKMENVLLIPLSMAADSAELARDVTMGVVFSRGPSLVEDDVRRLCLDISAEDKGAIGLTAVLSPNTILILGQGDTVKRFKATMRKSLHRRVHLRENDHRWPPLHSSITWQRSIPNRAALMMQTLPGGFVTPDPPVLSMAVPHTLYTDLNARDLLHQWTDHPQRLWDVVDHTLASGIKIILHVGPEPNLIPATYRRLSDNVTQQVTGRSLSSIGLRAMSGIVSRPWLASLLPSRTVLLRAPQIRHVMLEDWLLEHPPS